MPGWSTKSLSSTQLRVKGRKNRKKERKSFKLVRAHKSGAKTANLLGGSCSQTVTEFKKCPSIWRMLDMKSNEVET